MLTSVSVIDRWRGNDLGKKCKKQNRNAPGDVQSWAQHDPNGEQNLMRFESDRPDLTPGGGGGGGGGDDVTVDNRGVITDAGCNDDDDDGRLGL